MTESAVLQKIMKSDLCTGCGLCASLAPQALQMALDDKGFARPQSTGPVSADVDSLIDRFCPGLNIVQDPSPVNDHLLWGPIQACRMGHAEDPELRKHASSGGVISALATHLLHNKAVDYVVQVGAAKTSPIENETRTSKTAADVYDASGSRYAPSSPLADIHHKLDAPGRFALIGKPCDIAAMRALGRIDARVNDKIPVMISFFCAGVPSRKGTEKILSELKVSEEDVVDFRYRGDGWPGYATARKANGEAARMSYEASWGNILSKHVQFRCKLCPDGSGGLADVVCADSWDTDEKGYPVFAEREGLSLILSRTQKGEELVKAALAAGSIAAKPLDVSRIANMQPSQATRKRVVLARLMALRCFTSVVPRYKNLNLLRAAASASPVLNARNFLGLLRRLWRGRK